MKIIPGALAAIVLSLAEAATDRALRGESAPRLAEGDGEEWGSDSKANGAWCASDNQCASGRCSWRLRCDALIADDLGCGEDEDCASGYCTWHGGGWNKKCRPASERDEAGAKDNGAMCAADNQCKTGRCAFGNMWELKAPTCADKLADGESCSENEDCTSDLCEPAGGVEFKCVEPPAEPEDTEAQVAPTASSDEGCAFVETTVDNAEYINNVDNYKFFTSSEDVAQVSCDSVSNCLGYWQHASNGKFSLLFPGARSWKSNELPNPTVGLAKKKMCEEAAYEPEEPEAEPEEPEAEPEEPEAEPEEPEAEPEPPMIQ